MPVFDRFTAKRKERIPPSYLIPPRLGDVVSLLRRQGFVNAYAGIALPNPASVRLHESIGMRQVGLYERVGWKFGAWHDVAWYGMRLSEPMGQPPEPIPLPELG